MKKTGHETAHLQTRQLVCCAILSALSVILLLIGGVSGILDLTALVLVSLCIAFCVIEIDVPHAWLVWAVTAALSLLLLPTKEIGLLYLLGGMYPIAKSAFERFRPLICWLMKLSVFNAALVLYILAAARILGLSGLGYEFTVVTVLFGNVTFLVYDFSLTVFISLYLIRLRKRLRLPRLRK